MGRRKTRRRGDLYDRRARNRKDGCGETKKSHPAYYSVEAKVEAYVIYILRLTSLYTALKCHPLLPIVNSH